jgi:hypothetical protein
MVTIELVKCGTRDCARYWGPDNEQLSGLQCGSLSRIPIDDLDTVTRASEVQIADAAEERPRSGVIQKTYAHSEFYRP